MAGPTTATLVVKAAASAAADKRVRKVIGAVIMAVLSPFILAIALICAILGGGADHNKAAFSYVLDGGYMPPEAPVEYREYLKDMRNCFAKLDTVIKEKNDELSGGKLNSIRIKALFYAMQFGDEPLNFIDDYYVGFVEGFINEKETDDDPSETIYTRIDSMGTVYSNMADFIGRALTAEQKTNAENIYNNYFYGDNIPDDTYDFDGYWSGEITYLGGGTETKVVYYNQADKQWGSEPYGKSGTIASSGCGPTSLAMVVSTLTDKIIIPPEMATWAYKNGYRAEGNGSYHSLIPLGGKHYGLKVEGAARHEGQKVVDALSEGKLVIAIMSQGHFTKGGHFIVLRGITSDGRILVADPASIKRSEQSWPLSIILSEASGSAGAGGPFWIFSL